MALLIVPGVFAADNSTVTTCNCNCTYKANLSVDLSTVLPYCDSLCSERYQNMSAESFRLLNTDYQKLLIDSSFTKSSYTTCSNELSQCEGSRDNLKALTAQLDKDKVRCEEDLSNSEDNMKKKICSSSTWTDYWWLVLLGVLLCVVDEKWTRFVFNKKKPRELEYEDPVNDQGL
jgi:hypothetical protein